MTCKCVLFLYSGGVLPPWQSDVCRYAASSIVRADPKYIIIVITITGNSMTAQSRM